MCIFSGISLLCLLSHFVYGMLSNKLRLKYSCSQIWRKYSFITVAVAVAVSVSVCLALMHIHDTHVSVCLCEHLSGGEKKKKNAKQPQKQNCKQTNCKSFSIFILILSTISSKKHLANLWGGGTRQHSGSQQSEMAKERNGHEIQRYLFCIRRAGANKNGGKKLHISPMLSDIYSYNFIQFNLRRCVRDRVCICVCVCV